MENWLKDPQTRFSYGLGVIISGSKKIDRIVYSNKRTQLEFPVDLPRHPFGLDLPQRNPDPYAYVAFRRWKGIGFLGEVGTSDVSVNTFLAYVLEHLTSAVADCKIGYMRILYAQTAPDNDHHDVYFEIMVQHEIYMCGGCTDFSGSGGTAKDRLESVFAVLSMISGIEIQKIKIPFEQAHIGRHCIDNICTAAKE